jgi:hypothetical protein
LRKRENNRKLDNTKLKSRLLVRNRKRSRRKLDKLRNRFCCRLNTKGCLLIRKLSLSKRNVAKRRNLGLKWQSMITKNKRDLLLLKSKGSWMKQESLRRLSDWSKNRWCDEKRKSRRGCDYKTKKTSLS